jgi:3-hydroxyacyl-CoA dehydrogenase/enoyl-CoA hydratase/3-hydroxybutyryl-CoA epimerase
MVTGINKVQQDNLEKGGERKGMFTLQCQTSGIAHLIIDDKTESMNVLKAEAVTEVMQIIKSIKQDQNITGLIIVSGKKDSFIAGADIHMLSAMTNKAEIVSLSRQGQMIFDKLEKFNIPVVAAIHGACLGGGLELALACHQRVCSSSPKTLLGLPEVQLGLLPGSGGTQRLPKLIGIQNALSLMLTGKQLRAKQALKMGVVNDVVSLDILLVVAEKMVKKLQANVRKIKQKTAPKQTLIQKLLESNVMTRRLIYQQARKNIFKNTKGNYPAPLKILDCVEKGAEQSPAIAYQAESEHFADLVLSPESIELRKFFLSTTQVKNSSMNVNAAAGVINLVAIIGGGFMGGGIAYVTASKAKLPVRIKDISHQGISRVLNNSYQLLNKKVKRHFMSKNDMQRELSNITGTIDFSGVKHADIVIEAVFEDLLLKQKTLADIEQHCQPTTIFASNTSSIPIAKIALHAKRPENVVGIHYFSPVDKMPLVEVIPHQGTSDHTVATAVALVKKQGKIPIVVKDKAGFYVNRILAPYLNEALEHLLKGETVGRIDKALLDFGFPIGPLQLLDEVGIDIAAKINIILQQELGERFSYCALIDKLIKDGRLGKKSKRGFYQYSEKLNLKRKHVDESLYSLLPITQRRYSEPKAIAQRCVYLMLNEAAYCLSQEIISNARDGDIAAILGIGFPPFLGGPFSMMDNIGIVHIVQQLHQYQKEFGQHFKPCDLLITMAEKGEKFYK